MKNTMYWLIRTKGYRPSPQQQPQRRTLQLRPSQQQQCRCCTHCWDRMTLPRRQHQPYNLLVHTNFQYNSRHDDRQSFSSFASFTTTSTANTTASISTYNQWHQDEDEDEATFMRRRQQEPNLTRTKKKTRESIYVSIEEEKMIRELNKKHRYVKIRRDETYVDNNNTKKSTSTPLTFEQLEMQRLQFEQLQTKHYHAAKEIIRLGNELLLEFQNDTSTTENDNNVTTSSRIGFTKATGINSQPHHSKKQNYSDLLKNITSFTHSYFMLVNHHRIYQNKIINHHHKKATLRFWYQPEYRTTSLEAINVAFDLLQYILQQKILQVQPEITTSIGVVDQNETPKHDRRGNSKEMQEAELLQYELDLHEGYINDKNNSSNNNVTATDDDSTDDSTNTEHSEKNKMNDATDDDDDDDIGLISKNDTMWIYNPGIIYNPLIQVWKHMSIHHNNICSSSSSSSSGNDNYNGNNRAQHIASTGTSVTPNLDGRIVAREIAETVAITNAVTANGRKNLHGRNVDISSDSNENVLRTAQQVMEQFQRLILSAIEYTHYTNPLLLRQDLPHRSKNPKKVPYKLFYNSTTFNMVLEVLMHQHRYEGMTPPATQQQTKKKKKKKSANTFDIYSEKSKPTAAIMQDSFLMINDAIRKFIQQLHPSKDSDDGQKKKIGILEDVVNNYHKYLEDLNERYWTYPTPPKIPVWADEIEEKESMKEALQEAALADQSDKDGNSLNEESEEVEIPIRYTTVNPTTYPPRDTIGLGMLFRPDIHTYNLFMKTWALKCPDVKFAAVQVHRMYKDMQQEGFELTPNVETYNVMLHFYATHPDEFVHVVERLIQYLIDKQGIRNVQLMHWYYAIETHTAVQKHRFKAKEYLENMIYSSHHHKFLSKKNDGDAPYTNITIIAEDDDDLQSIAIIQRAAQLLMIMYRKEVQHHIEVIQHTNKYVKDTTQSNATISNSNKEIDIALRSSFDLYIKLKETGFLEFAGEENNDDGYLQYRDEIRSTFMDIYAYAGQMQNAMKIFHRIIRTNLTHYVTLIDAYGKHDDIDAAESIYEMMINDQNVAQLNCDVFTTLMNGYANSTKYSANQLADSIIGVMRRWENEPKCTQYNIRPDTETYNTLLKCLCDISIDAKNKKSDVRFLRALSILDEMERCTKSDDTQNSEPLVKPTISTYLKIVQTGLKVEDFDGVLKVIERMAMTPISDATPTKRYLNSESNHSIFHMFREVNTFEALDYMIKLMNRLNQWADEKLTLLRPTAGTYSVLYKACVDLNQLSVKRSRSSECRTRKIIERLYEQMKGANINPNHSTYTELIDYYAQSKRREDLEFASDLLMELEDKNDPSMKSDERQYHALFYGYLNNIGDTSAAAQILFRYTKGYLAMKIKDRPSGLLYQTILKTYIESDELIKGALFVDQIHLLQRDEPLLDNVKGVTVQLDKLGVPHHLGPDVVTMGNLIKAIKLSTWMEKSDKDFYKRLLTKHSDAVKRFHRRRQKIKGKALFKYI